MIYPVNDLYLSIQGEGALTGVPMVVLRLQGCGVGCPWCDTKQTWELDEKHIVSTLLQAQQNESAWLNMRIDEIVSAVVLFGSSIEWVLLTGGEPSSYDLQPLVTGLHLAGKKVALETSGTAAGCIGARCDWVCVSPKIGMPGGKTIKRSVMSIANEIKFVVGKRSDVDRLSALLKEYDTKPEVVVSVQPVSQSPRATRICVEASKVMGWRLSIQIHKIIGAK